MPGRWRHRSSCAPFGVNGCLGRHAGSLAACPAAAMIVAIALRNRSRSAGASGVRRWLSKRHAALVAVQAKFPLGFPGR
jgi:hypothetical protein